MAQILDEDPEITHVSMVHSETTSGILNDIESVAKVVKEKGRTMIVDAMSSFGGVDIPVGDWGIDFIISSANKCIQGVPGFSFIIADNNRLLIEKMAELGIRPYIDGAHHGPIITTFFYPENVHFSFAEMYQYIKERGYAIYPGKVTEADTFRIGNIGEIYEEDILKVSALIKEFLEKEENK